MSQDGRTFTMGGGMAPANSPGAAAPSDGTCDGSISPSSITLAVPRPENERSTNLYVDTPFQHKVSPRREEVTLPHGSRTQDLPMVHSGGIRSSLHRPHLKKTSGAPSFPHEITSLQKQKTEIVTTQPTPLTFIKRSPKEDSIICGRCGRCRCEACSTPRPPSGAWICGGKCHISPKTAVDYLSCLCCVKGVLYHCGKDDDEETPSVDRPCSCSGNDACLRWACLTLSTVPLPCLLCYWPLNGVRALCEKTYQRFSTQGCRCIPSTTENTPTPPCRLQPLSNAQPEKRLLHDCV